ncbi:MAG TPA: 5-oxoprolinase subunit PxpB [Xanthomonadaceae bacterium]|nr:5-oxoprolinase subunit PxpB [Xanthomonadaceae bacterium]
MDDMRIEFLGDAALLLRLGERIDAAINRRVHAYAALLRAQAPNWLIDITPAYSCLALHVDVARIDVAHVSGALASRGDPLGVAREWLADWLARSPVEVDNGAARTVEVPVAYGGDNGPDLAAVATQACICVDEVVSRHSCAEYSVAMLGFAPGFSYLLGLDASLVMPRLATPRTRVAAGSVGIGGAQTGIYPNAGPGGWRLIGRTPLRLFDAQRDPPTLLRAGDRVRFIAIDAATFDEMNAHPQ